MVPLFAMPIINVLEFQNVFYADKAFYQISFIEDSNADTGAFKYTMSLSVCYKYSLVHYFPVKC